MGLNDEKMLSLILVIFTLWILVNPFYVSEKVGIIYTFFVVIYMVQLAMKQNVVEIVRRVDKKSIVYFVVGLTAVIVFTNLIYAFSILSLESVINYKHSYVNYITKSTSIIWTKIVYGLAIPIAESMMFLSVIPSIWVRIVGISLNTNVKSNLIKVIWVCLLTGITASLFHLLVRSVIASNSSVMFDKLMMTDIMFFSVSMFITFLSRQMVEALAIHSIINIMAV